MAIAELCSWKPIKENLYVLYKLWPIGGAIIFDESILGGWRQMVALGELLALLAVFTATHLGK